MLSTNSVNILNFLQGAGAPITAKALAAELGLKTNQITGSVTAMCTKGLMERVKETLTDENGKDVVITKIVITEKGKTFDAVAANAQEEADKEATKAAKKALKEKVANS